MSVPVVLLNRDEDTHRKEGKKLYHQVQRFKRTVAITRCGAELHKWRLTRKIPSDYQQCTRCGAPVEEEEMATESWVDE